jgi:hypothetical protein
MSDLWDFIREQKPTGAEMHIHLRNNEYGYYDLVDTIDECYHSPEFTGAIAIEVYLFMQEHFEGWDSIEYIEHIADGIKTNRELVAFAKAQLKQLDSEPLEIDTLFV